MDCLSHFFDWDQPIQLQDCFIPDVDTTNPETDSFFFQSQPQLQYHQPLFQEEAPSQTLLELTDLDYLCDQFLPPQETCLPYPKTEIFNETHDLDSFLPTPKLVNSSYQCHTRNHFSSPSPNFFNYYDQLDLAPEASIFPNFQVPDFPLEFKVGRGDEDRSSHGTKKPSLSSQSIAARERRRRITDKTHELTKLIPGGQKLNTAEMFEAAAKYVKFLQSQVGILQMMQNTTKTHISDAEIETRVLLGSQAIQEKLSTDEVCLVPCGMVRDLASEESIWRNPMISGKINKFLSADMSNNF
ncbi:Transcription factor bHLH53 [Raphanus sativus]|uniref:Transcription factor bHLH53-like n=1 Tax=Raphanus sativus TaxID=3726 RepID=A0A9W3BZ16_RAPSA|nr:transcription factor bHLH53-like [Raphanus sativus]KAJ4891659.1 Transcription factor bHLH53 [Raphanus sativus]